MNIMKKLGLLNPARNVIVLNMSTRPPLGSLSLSLYTPTPGAHLIVLSTRSLYMALTSSTSALSSSTASLFSPSSSSVVS